MTYEKFRKEFGRLETEEGTMTENQMHSLYHRTKENMAKTKISPKGNCMKCDQVQEQVLPTVVHVCKDCAEKLIRRYMVEDLKEKLPMKAKFEPFSLCEYCGKRGNRLIEMNVRFCVRCLVNWSKIIKERNEEELENKWRKKWVKRV